MLTITITRRAVFLAALVALAGVLAFYATDALGSGATPEAYIQGDTNCDGIINGQDALNNLRYTAGLSTGPFPNCPAVGSEAAIPGPQGPPGPPGPQGPPGDEGPPGTLLFANVTRDGLLEGGTAVEASKLADGRFAVGFGEDITGCAAVANAGTLLGGSVTAAMVTTWITDISPQVVQVDFFDPSYGKVNTDFHLIVVC